MSYFQTQSLEKVNKNKIDEGFEISPWEIEESMDMEYSEMPSEPRKIINSKADDAASSSAVRRIKSSVVHISNTKLKPIEDTPLTSATRQQQSTPQENKQQGKFFSKWPTNSEQHQNKCSSGSISGSNSKNSILLNGIRTKVLSARASQNHIRLPEQHDFRPLSNSNSKMLSNQRELFLSKDQGDEKMNHYLSFYERVQKNEAKIINLSLGMDRKREKNCKNLVNTISTVDQINSNHMTGPYLKEEKKISTFAYKYKRGIKLRKAEQAEKTKQVLDDFVNRIQLTNIITNPNLLNGKIKRYQRSLALS